MNWYKIANKIISVYHGSKTPIEIFDNTKQISGFYPGFYTSYDKNKAQQWGQFIYEFKINPSLFFPLTLDNMKQIDVLAAKNGFGQTSGSGYPIAKYLKSLGYKGINRGTEYILFDPTEFTVEPPIKKSL
jgi:hypothetical protein